MKAIIKFKNKGKEYTVCGSNLSVQKSDILPLYNILDNNELLYCFNPNEILYIEWH